MFLIRENSKLSSSIGASPGFPVEPARRGGEMVLQTPPPMKLHGGEHWW
jgi:hypothetical protein